MDEMGKTAGVGLIIYSGSRDDLQRKLRARDDRITELEAFVLDLMTAHGPGTLVSDELFERGAALARTTQR